jgi:hypothetical protein
VGECKIQRICLLRMAISHGSLFLQKSANSPKAFIVLGSLLALTRSSKSARLHSS